MSFDEQPDGDIHGECAAEIASLTAEITRLRAELEAAKKRERINPLGDTSTEWDTLVGKNLMTCHTRILKGVLCRWWGDGPEPEGVALIDAIAREKGEEHEIK